MRYLLVPPSVMEAPAGPGPLLRRVQIPRGITLIRRYDDSIYQSRYPAQTELEAAAEYWLGGHHHVIDQAARDLLVTAGYGAYISDYLSPGGFDMLPFGQGPFGGYDI